MDPLTGDSAYKIKRMTFLLYGFGSLFVLSFLVLGYGIFSDIHQESEYDPLGDYPVQMVTAEVILDDGTKAVYLDEPVEVEGIKCNDSINIVTVEGSLTWQAVEPRGVLISTGEGTSEKEPGCTTTIFQNQIPTSVHSAITAQHLRGIDQPLWRIVGIEYPIDEDGARGEPRRFETENFVVLTGSGE